MDSLTATWLSSVVITAALGSAAAVGGVPSFEKLDRDGNGHVSAEEASARHGLRELMAEYDRNGDDRLDRREYQSLLEDAAREARQVSASNDTGQ